MITTAQYFGRWIDHPDATAARRNNAVTLLDKVNPLLDAAVADGVELPVNPVTGTQVSGETLGGFRPQNAAQGSPASSHKQGRGVDVQDAKDALDTWLDQFETGDGGNTKLEEYGLYREHPSATKHWCHLTDRAPGSGKRTFMP